LGAPNETMGPVVPVGIVGRKKIKNRNRGEERWTKKGEAIYRGRGIRNADARATDRSNAETRRPVIREPARDEC